MKQPLGRVRIVGHLVSTLSSKASMLKQARCGRRRRAPVVSTLSSRASMLKRGSGPLVSVGPGVSTPSSRTSTLKRLSEKPADEHGTRLNALKRCVYVEAVRSRAPTGCSGCLNAPSRASTLKRHHQPGQPDALAASTPSGRASTLKPQRLEGHCETGDGLNALNRGGYVEGSTGKPDPSGRCCLNALKQGVYVEATSRPVQRAAAASLNALERGVYVEGTRPPPRTGTGAGLKTLKQGVYVEAGWRLGPA